MLVMTSGSEEYWVISVPAEGSVTSSVSSVVHMVGSCVGRGGLGGSVGVTAGRLGVPPSGEGTQLETVQLLHLSGLAQSGALEDHRRGPCEELERMLARCSQSNARRVHCSRRATSAAI